MKIIRRSLFVGAAALVAAVAVPLANAQSTRDAGPILLTVTGAVENPNRGGYDPEMDKFFGYNEVEFTTAREFDFEALKALQTVSVKADFPKGRQVHEFEGPLLVDVLKEAGAQGDTIIVQALDGYAVEVPYEKLIELGAMVALKRDGIPFGIGDFGPTQIVFPRAERADLKDMPDDFWVWSIFHINVK